jgi:Domain of unknown function (DUF4335)
MTVFTVPPTPESETVQAPDAVVRTYNAPTCTLEISANSSPLSRWTQKPTLKNQRFNLHFDDPRVGEDQWMVLRGDRIKLEALTEAVASYVQTFLTRSNTLSLADADGELTTTITPEMPGPAPQGITLQPKGLLAHTLSLGTLATETTGPDLTLTSTQLADLASVLDEHSTETIALPVLTRRFAWTRSPAVWGKIAAGTLLSVGLSATVLNQLGKPTQQQIATTSASSNDQRNAPMPLPSPSVSSPLLPPGASIPPGGVAVPPPLNGGAIATAPDPAPSTETSDPTNSAPNSPDSANSNAPAEAPGTTTKPTQRADTSLKGTVVDTPEPGVASTSKKSAVTVAGVPVSPVPGSSGRSRPNVSPESAEDPAPPAIDRSTQFGEIQAWVKNQWKPAEKLSEEVAYVLEVDPSGKVISVTPQSELAKKYLSYLPVPGTTVASALAASTNIYKIQLVLSPDGTMNASPTP